MADVGHDGAVIAKRPDSVTIPHAEEMPSGIWWPMDLAPRDGTDILVVLWGTTLLVLSYDAENEEHPWLTLDGPAYHKDAPTHWMPLPSLPRVTDSGGKEQTNSLDAKTLADGTNG